MSTFTLDTSGRVAHPHRTNIWFEWPDLSPFAQGYVEALFGEAHREYFTHNGVSSSITVPLREFRKGFRDLSPEALALILRDCEAYSRYFGGDTPRENGGHFWFNRQQGHLREITNDGVTRHYPPLTPRLSDDGKVCLRVAETSEAATTPS